VRVCGCGEKTYDGWGPSVSASSWMAHELHGLRLKFSPRAQLGEFFFFSFLFLFCFLYKFSYSQFDFKSDFKFQSKCNNQSISMNAKYDFFISIYKWFIHLFCPNASSMKFTPIIHFRNLMSLSMHTFKSYSKIEFPLPIYFRSSN
jgi:hypothetical protein